jgi:hypothetical protein
MWLLPSCTLTHDAGPAAAAAGSDTTGISVLSKALCREAIGPWCFSPDLGSIAYVGADLTGPLKVRVCASLCLSVSLSHTHTLCHSISLPAYPAVSITFNPPSSVSMCR